jgi:hypothetical protein
MSSRNTAILLRALGARGYTRTIRDPIDRRGTGVSTHGAGAPGDWPRRGGLVRHHGAAIGTRFTGPASRLERRLGTPKDSAGAGDSPQRPIWALMHGIVLIALALFPGFFMVGSFHVAG